MNILVLGATGGTGKFVVSQLLQLGYKVTVLARNPSKVNITHANLKVSQGDVIIPSSLESIMQNQDAVICCLGAPAMKAGNVRSVGTKNIIHAMQQKGVSRLICQSSLGFDDSEVVLQNVPFLMRKIVIPFLLGTTFEEHHKQEILIKKSNLNWTIVRPVNMTHGAFTGDYKHGFSYSEKNLKFKIAKADVADFMIKQLTSNEYLKQATGISY